MIYCVVVARAGTHAKTRLGPVLTAPQRRRLVVAMLSDVLAACRASPLVDGVIAVLDPAAADHVATDVEVVADPGGDMNAAASLGISTALRHGADTVIVLPADVPLITTGDLSRLVHAASDAARAVVIGASRDGHGTNALLLRPPTVIAPAFGPPSVDRHQALAIAAHCHVVVLRDLCLALDVDTPEDLDALRASATLSTHTAAALSRLNLRFAH